MGGWQWGKCRQRWGGNTEHGSSAPKSERLAAAVQSASLRPFRGGGGVLQSNMAWEGVQALSQCLSPPPMQHPHKELHSHTLKTLSKSASSVASPSILSTFAQRDPKSPDCVVDDDDNDVNGEEDKNDVTMYAQC